MKTGNKLPVTALLLTTPLAAYAQSIPHIAALYTFGGGLAGGFFGAMLACWMYNRMRESKSDADLKR